MALQVVFYIAKAEFYWHVIWAVWWQKMTSIPALQNSSSTSEMWYTEQLSKDLVLTTKWEHLGYPNKLQKYLSIDTSSNQLTF